MIGAPAQAAAAPAHGAGRPPGGTGKAEGIPVWWLGVAAALIAVRVAVIVFSTSPTTPMTADEPFYEDLAHSLLSGHGFARHGVATALRAPGWPLVLAAIHGLFGGSRRVVVLWQALFDGASAVCLSALAWRLFGMRSATAVAFVMVLAWPPFITTARYMQTEPLFTLLVSAMLLTSLRGLLDGGRWAFLVGLLCGAASLVRPPALVLLAGMAGGWWLFERPRAARVVRTGVAIGLGMMLVLSPWIVRNAVVFRAFIPLSLGTGDQLYQGVMLETAGRWNHQLWLKAQTRVLAEETQRLGHQPDAMESDRALTRAALRIIREHPWESLVIAIKRVWRLVFTPLISTDRTWLRVGYFTAILALYVLAAPAVARARRARDAIDRFPLAMVTGWCLVLGASTALFTTSRYAEPFRTVPMVLTAGTIGIWLARRRRGGPTSA